MKLNYEVEWELDDDFIDDIVNEVEEVIKNYPDSDIDECIPNITEDRLSDLDTYDCDHFNMEIYLDEVVEEVKKRYFDRKAKSKSVPLHTTPTEELHSDYIQRIDDIGRICIPKHVRDTLKIESGDPFECFFDNDNDLILKPYRAFEGSFDTDHNLIIKKYHGQN